MRRPLLAAGVVAGLFLALLVVGVLLVPGPAHGTFHDELEANQSVPIGPPEFDSAERLVLPEGDVRSAEAHPAVDPGLATSNEFAHLKHDWKRQLFTADLADESTSEGKVAVLEATVEELRADVIAMNRAEKEAYVAFAAGEIGPEEFLARLAVIEQQGMLLEDRLDGVRSASRGITSPVVQDNVTSLQATVGWLQLETETFSGPLRNNAWQSIAGEATHQPPISVSASKDGYVLAASDDVMYTREIYHSGNHDRAGGGFLSMQEGTERVAQLYPWTDGEAFEQDPRVRGDIFREQLTHPHGTTTTFFSGATELPYREIHEIDLAAVPTITAASEQNGELVVTIERTYAGGPAQVIATTPEGEPIGGATVEIADHRNRVTGDGGTVWFTTTDQELSIVVSADGAEVAITAELPVGSPPGG